MVLSIGTHWVELLFSLRQRQLIYVRSDVELPYARHRRLSSYGSCRRHCKVLFMERE